MKLNLNKNCFWGHKWSKLEEVEVECRSIVFKEAHDKLMQKRTCLRCGKVKYVNVS
jgi:hypothetical protein